MDAELEIQMQAVNARLTAVAALLARLVATTDPELPGPRHPSLDSLLADAGLSHSEIAKLLRKDRSNVSRQLARDSGKAG